MWQFLSDDRSWVAYNATDQALIECAFQRGDATVTIDPSCVIRFVSSSQVDAQNVVRPVRRLEVVIIQFFVATDSGVSAMDDVTCAQISSWPMSQPCLFRPMGDFYLSSGFAYAIDLSRCVQINLNTGVMRQMYCTTNTFPLRPTNALDLTYNMQILFDAGVKISAQLSAMRLRRLEPVQQLRPAQGRPVTDVDKVAAECTSPCTDAASDAECAICIQPLLPQAAEATDDTVVKISCCNNLFHRKCIILSFTYNKTECPLCRCQHATRTGNQPDNGSMDVYRSTDLLPSFECSSSGTFVIKYSFPSGVQGNHHPHPGRPYAGGSDRFAYLPINPDGERILRLLQVAWELGLIFTVGESVTLGPQAGDRVVWNGIHHKTSFTGQYGYPDPGYFIRVTEELASVGVKE